MLNVIKYVFSMANLPNIRESNPLKRQPTKESSLDLMPRSIEHDLQSSSWV